MTADSEALTDDVGAEHGQYRVEILPAASHDLLVLAGEISLDAANQLRDVARQTLTMGREVALDWSQATRVSAGALQVLLALRVALDARGLQLSVTDDNPGIRSMLELAGLSQAFPVREGAG